MASPASLAETYEVSTPSPKGWPGSGSTGPTPREVASLAEEFQLHELAVEDAIVAHQRPKLERYGDTLFVVLRPARYLDEIEEVEFGEVHVFVGPDFVLTVRHSEAPDLGAVRQRLESDPELLRRGPEAVLYAILDKVVDGYFPVVAGLENDIDEIEIEVFSGDPAGVPSHLRALPRGHRLPARHPAPRRDAVGALRRFRASTGSMMSSSGTCGTSKTTSRRSSSASTSSARCCATCSPSTPRWSPSSRTRR